MQHNNTKKECKKTNMCQMCLMPEEKDTGVRERADFCSYCFKHGKILFKGTRKEFQTMVYKQMRTDGVSWIMAHVYAWMIRFAPYWRGKQTID
ncbi:MAG: zinc ribbon domain-containing protein [Alphaproteobacteria bacterium]|nr:zinc ribbon domain-containing protein [Alphaproteobacteria bacterium]